MLKKRKTRVIDLDKDGAKLTDKDKAVARKFRNKRMDRMLRQSDMRTK